MMIAFPNVADAKANSRARAAAIAWCSILAGALSGMLMGLWSFDGPVPTPEWIRRLRFPPATIPALGPCCNVCTWPSAHAGCTANHRSSAWSKT